MQFNKSEGKTEGFMELSPKQQTVNEIKNAKNILIIGHTKPGGDQIGSILALNEGLKKIQKNVTAIITEATPKEFSFLPNLQDIKNDYRHTDGKILRIDTKRIPIDGMKWRKDDEYLDIHLETEKNLKFEFIEIINGLPKPDLVIVIDTPFIKDIDKTFSDNEKLFLETPIINIDHHAGNEYFGAVNLVDLTATSTAEILVSLFEALGIKIDTPDMATCLLTGILHDTQSFRSQNTTPKSLTVAAQLLAAGGRQQEIINNLYNNRAEDLMRLWEDLVKNTEKDEERHILWSFIEEGGYPTAELAEASQDLLEQNKGFEVALIFARESGEASATVVTRATNIAKSRDLAEMFDGSLEGQKVIFQVKEGDIETAIKIVLKKLAEKWSNPDQNRKQVWDIIDKEPEQSPVPTEPIRKHQPLNVDVPKSIKEKEDAIEEALKSISQAEKDENRKEMESLRDVLDRKRVKGIDSGPKKTQKAEEDIYEDE